MTESTGQLANSISKTPTSAKAATALHRSAMRKLISDYTPEAVQFLVDLMRNEGASYKDRSRAAMFIVDHTIGKPTGSVVDQNGDPATLAGITVNFVSTREPRIIDATYTTEIEE